MKTCSSSSSSESTIAVYNADCTGILLYHVQPARISWCTMRAAVRQVTAVGLISCEKKSFEKKCKKKGVEKRKQTNKKKKNHESLTTSGWIPADRISSSRPSA